MKNLTVRELLNLKPKNRLNDSTMCSVDVHQTMDNLLGIVDQLQAALKQTIQDRNADKVKKLTTIGQLANCANCAEFSETLIRWDDENDPYVVVDCEKNINDKVNFDPCKNWNKE